MSSNPNQERAKIMSLPSLASRLNLLTKVGSIHNLDLHVGAMVLQKVAQSSKEKLLGALSLNASRKDSDAGLSTITVKSDAHDSSDNSDSSDDEDDSRENDNYPIFPPPVQKIEIFVRIESYSIVSDAHCSHRPSHEVTEDHACAIQDPVIPMARRESWPKEVIQTLGWIHHTIRNRTRTAGSTL